MLTKNQEKKQTKTFIIIMRSDLCSEAQPAISIECADLGSFGGEGQTLTTFF